MLYGIYSFNEYIPCEAITCPVYTLLFPHNSYDDVKGSVADSITCLASSLSSSFLISQPASTSEAENAS